MSFVEVKARVRCDGCKIVRPVELTVSGESIDSWAFIRMGWYDQPNFGRHFCPACTPAAKRQERLDEEANACKEAVAHG